MYPIAAVTFQSEVIPIKLDDVVDSKSDNVPKHLGEIADSMYEWKGKIADELRLTRADVAEIETRNPHEIKQQALVMMIVLFPWCIILQY